VSAGVGIVSEPLMSIYGATKFAVEGFTESIAYECASQNISVKLIEPRSEGRVRFPLTVPSLSRRP
jgi:short-subunit dehydrogenase